MAEFIDKAPSKIQPDGLRYKAKPGGTPFALNKVGSNMSCLLCGQHKPREEGTFKAMFNARQFICFSCRPPKTA